MSANTVRMFIIFSILMCIMAIIIFIGIGNVDGQEYGIVSVVAGVLVRELQTIIDYYFKDSPKNGDIDSSADSSK
jgi:hypothetical protein